jgi:septum site-determining protein MinD
MDHVGLPLLGLIPEDPSVPVAAANGSALVLRSRKGAAMACLRISRRLLGMDAPLMHIRY